MNLRFRMVKVMCLGGVVELELEIGLFDCYIKLFFKIFSFNY